QPFWHWLELLQSTHIPFWQTPVAQSCHVMQCSPLLHGPQSAPPQSTPVSSPSWHPSPQFAGKQSPSTLQTPDTFSASFAQGVQLVGSATPQKPPTHVAQAG